MPAYYNEHDPKAAAWLRELIKEGVIAPGEVDERSIEDVIPTELAGFSQCHFFAGIGVWSYALRSAGWPDDRPVWTGSCPCQPFSTAGKGEGFTDERHLWPSWFHLIEQCRPRTVFGEQVSSKDGLTWFDLVSSDLEGALYTVGASDICAAGVGAPHIRQRLYFVADAESEGISRGCGESNGAREVAGIWNGANAGDGGEPLTVAESVSEQNESTATRRFHAESGERGSNDRLADASSRRRQCEQNGQATGIQQTALRASKQRLKSGAHSATSSRSVAHPDVSPGLGGIARTNERPISPGNGAMRPDVELVNPESDGREQGRAESERIERGFNATERGESNALGEDPGRIGRRGRDNGCDAGEAGQSETENQIARPGLTNGFWRDAEWLYCRDEKYRPTKPGLFPLVDGIAGRVALLRGAGNGLVSENAKEWIAAYMVLRGDYE